MTQISATRTETNRETNREIIRQAFDAWRQGTDEPGPLPPAAVRPSHRAWAVLVQHVKVL